MEALWKSFCPVSNMGLCVRILVVSQILRSLPSLPISMWVCCQQQSSRSVVSNIPHREVEMVTQQLFVYLQGELVKGDDLHLGQRIPREFQMTRNGRLQRWSLHRIVHRCTLQGSSAQVYAMKFKMQSANTFFCGLAFRHSAPGLSC